VCLLRRFLAVVAFGSPVISFRLKIDIALGNAGEELIGPLLLVERLLQKARHVLHTVLLGPGTQGAVAGNFVMLDRLRRREQTGVERVAALELSSYLIGFLDQSQDRVTGLGLRALVGQFENPFNALDVALRLPRMCLKCLAKLGRVRCLRHFRQGAHELLLGVIYVLQRLEEEIAKILRF
jgi:hypothetical protein